MSYSYDEKFEGIILVVVRSGSVLSELREKWNVWCH